MKNKIQFDDSVKVDKDDLIGVKFISGSAYNMLYKMLATAGNVKIVTCGSLRQVHYPDGSIKKYFLNDMKTAGTHICYHVRLDVESRIESGEYKIQHENPELFPSEYNFTSLYQFWNKEGIRYAIKNFKGQIRGIDINYCYWNTLKNIGAIGDRVYNMGLKKKDEWKLARNMSVGSLDKKYITQIIDENGKVTVFKKESELGGVRLDIIAHVYKMSVAIAKALGDKFCFFFTDCYFVSPDAVEDTIRMLNECGFEAKVSDNKIMDFIKKSKSTFELTWERTDRIRRGESAEDCVSNNVFNLRNDLNNQPDYILFNGKAYIDDEIKA